jgi:hypothetical protein
MGPTLTIRPLDASGHVDISTSRCARAVTAETPDTLTLTLPDGRSQHVPVASIDERASGPSSMPTDLADKLTRRELRDLLAWLQSLR